MLVDFGLGGKGLLRLGGGWLQVLSGMSCLGTEGGQAPVGISIKGSTRIIFDLTSQPQTQMPYKLIFFFFFFFFNPKPFTDQHSFIPTTAS